MLLDGTAAFDAKGVGISSLIVCPQGRRVRIGVGIEPLTPVWSITAATRMARLLGVDDVWFADHTKHFFPQEVWNPKTVPLARLVPNPHAFLDPTVVIARHCEAKGRTGRARLGMGTMVTDPVRRSAADLARVWMSLHHLTRGNVVCGIGSGEIVNLLPIGAPSDRLVSRLADTLPAIRAAWSADGKPVTHCGEFHQWNDAPFLPRYKGSTPPVWVAAQGPRACSLAGQWGDGWVYLNQDFKEWKEAARRVRRAAEEAGRDVAAMDWTFVSIVIPASRHAVFRRAASSVFTKIIALMLPATAWEQVGAVHPFGPDFTGPQAHDFSFVLEHLDDVTKAVTPDLVEELMPCGPAERIRASFEEYVEAGVSYIVQYNVALVSDASVALQSLQEHRKLVRMLKRMSPGHRMS